MRMNKSRVSCLCLFLVLSSLLRLLVLKSRDDDSKRRAMVELLLLLVLLKEIAFPLYRIPCIQFGFISRSSDAWANRYSTRRQEAQRLMGRRTVKWMDGYWNFN